MIGRQPDPILHLRVHTEPGAALPTTPCNRPYNARLASPHTNREGLFSGQIVSPPLPPFYGDLTPSWPFPNPTDTHLYGIYARSGINPIVPSIDSKKYTNRTNVTPQVYIVSGGTKELVHVQLSSAAKSSTAFEGVLHSTGVSFHPFAVGALDDMVLVAMESSDEVCCCS